MTFMWPIGFVLLIPLALTLWLWRMPSRMLTVMRIITTLLILLAICGPAIRLPSRAGTVIVVTDQSQSMPPNSRDLQNEAIELIQSAMSSSDSLGVVSFAQSSLVAQTPGAGKTPGGHMDMRKDASNLNDALDMALSLIPPESPGRIMVLSDGRWTGLNPTSSATRAAARRIAIDYRCIERTTANDTAIVRLDAPAAVTPGESFMLTAWVRSPVRQEISYSLTGGGKVLASGKRTVPSGLSRITFRDKASQPGTNSYRLTVTGGDGDPMPENNSAKLLLGVRGPRPILIVAPQENTALSKLLSGGQLSVSRKTPDQCDWSLEGLSNYSAVLIEDVPASQIGSTGMENLAAWVTQIGSGLMMTGGKNSFGPGGYFKSPLDEIMPVSMELRREHRKLSLAIVVALDRSGSMAAGVSGGRTKMDLANIASVQVLDLLSGMDEFGCIAVDSAPHTIVPLTRLDGGQAARARSRILRIDSMGGGIFVYEALKSAVGMLAKAEAGTKHMILFADAADAEQPGQYKELLAKCTKAGITVSVIGLGTPGDSDAAFLQDVARRGGGRCFFTNKATELPRLFAQDTFVVARSSFLEDLTKIQAAPGLSTLTTENFAPLPDIGGYNLCYLRDGTNLAALSVDQYKAPIIASWHAGAGRVLCYTGQADGKFTGPMANWPRTGSLFTSMARWVAGDYQSLPEGMLVTQRLENGICEVTLHLDPEREGEPFSRAPVVTSLHDRPGSQPRSTQSRMQWTSPDSLSARLSVGGDETVLVGVDVPGVGEVILPPQCMLYSPEYQPRDAGFGEAALQSIARATGGKDRTDLTGIWKDLPRYPRMVPIGRWLLLIAVVLVLLEVLQRHSGLLSSGLQMVSFQRMGKAAGKIAQAISRSTAAPGRPAASAAEQSTARSAPPDQPAPATDAQPPAPPPAPKPEAPKAEPESTGSVMDALNKARRRAKGRTQK